MTEINVVDSTKNLIDVCDSGIKGYRRASEVVEDENIQAILLGYAEKREEYRAQLIEHILEPLNIEIQDRELPDILGVLHRNWIALQGVFEGDVHVLYACEQADYVALGIYEELLEELENPDYRTIIQSQKDGIQRTWEHMRELQEQHQ